mmetsp:Transcript_44914/g.124911  ORF Transcript_44914/g.124911 Transcript_44914/m.124911 type:complete len:754 (-) Transcript_44914:201-2462(-)|eukprot:CAMPEP_0179076974 /NCGR_PEP_ID=MMETSP0796-20121207/34378_1 /TAXON_ID=73915 /ORGANISM="Pyrodinium bahamense, Strain pbaha01" /LENGTH=753 /DNA_ID=CAMNT_0020774245 /DNA_START=104 /DNA_END=2365 /DNA_ORIENTATION=-
MTTKPVAKGDAIELNFEYMTVEQGLTLIEVERVQPLLKYLKTGIFENKTNMTFMKAYSVVVQFGDQQQHSFKLYSYYKKVISEYCEESVALMNGCSGEELLKRLAELWEKQTILVFWMQRVFQYLDRFFTKNNNEYPDLFSAALRSFQEAVYDRVKDKCIGAMIETINRERNGNDIDQDVISLLVEMLCTVGDPQPKIVKQKDVCDRLLWQSSSKGFYKNDFETKLLSTTAEYYRGKVAGWLAECSCPQFLEEADRRLKDEEKRLKQYLDRSSEQELRVVVQRELILNTAKQLVEMDSGCQAMFLNRKHEELTNMYRLFRREAKMLPFMTAVMEPYIEQRCAKIVEDPQMVDDPPQYIQEVLELKTELDNMVATCFDNDSGFQKARNRGLENILNKDTRCAKYLAGFCDLQLKKGLKGRNEDEMNLLVGQVVSLFAHLKDKDIFLDFYKRALSRRLLNKLSVSNDAEDTFITKLKVECGQQAIQKLASMFTDMALSDQLQEEYNRLSHGGSPGGIVHEVRVLQTNAWPEKADEANIVPCEEMLNCIQAFESFYHSKHSGRKLRWIYNMGGVDVTAQCFPRKHILVVSAYQCLALMLFNKQKEVTFREVCEATKLPKEECKRQVLSMTVSKHRLLLRDGNTKDIEDETKLEVNEQFTNEKIKVVVGLIKKEEKVAETAVAEAPVERKHVIDAAIVRIMKSRKKLDHNSLLEEVFRQCTLFKPQPSQIKVQVEHLIEREFLKRDTEKRNVYIYLP